MDALSVLKLESIKEEQHNMPLNYLSPGDQIKQSPNSDKNSTNSSNSLPSVSVCLLSKPNDLTNDHSKTLGQNIDDKDHVSSSKNVSRNMADSHIDCEGHFGSTSILSLAANDESQKEKVPQDNIPDDSRPGNSFAADQSVLSTLYEKPMDSKHDEMMYQPQTVQNCVAIPVEELSHFQQLEIEADEVFVRNSDDNKKMDGALDLSNTIQQTKNHLSSDIGSVSGKTKIKVHEYKRTMQTRSSPRIQSFIKSGIYQQILGHKNYPCNVCKESFPTKISLGTHVSNFHHGLEEKSGKIRDSGSFKCPVCYIACKRKFGLKRHFTSKHLSVKIIYCITCNYEAKNFKDYVKHIDNHELSTDTSLQSLEETNNTDKNEMMKCQECQEVFKDNDIMCIHTLNHKIATSLSQTEQSVSAENISKCSCYPITEKRTNDSHCVLHTSSSNSVSDINSQIPFSCLSQELKVETEKSLDIMSKVLSKLESLTQSVRADCTSPSSQGAILMTTVNSINQVSSLSSEFTNLSTTLGYILLCKEQKKNEEIRQERQKVETDILGYEEIDDNEKNEETLSVKDEKHKNIRTKKINKKLSKSKVKTQLEHDNYHVCQTCGKKFGDVHGLNRHLRIHSNKRPFECNLCQAGFRRNDHLLKHMKIHSKKSLLFKCEVCNYVAKSSKRLHSHSLTHGDDSTKLQVPCAKCSFIGCNAYILSKHENIHKPCPLCGYEAVDDIDYKSHKRSHSSFSCKECSFTCSVKWQLYQHNKKLHNTDEVKKMFCELCGFSGIDKRRFAYHMARHENKTPYACKECDYKCSSRTSLDSHKLMHAGLRPYLCSFCGASFRRTSHLDNHMLIHKDLKKFACGTCGRKFRASYNCKMHEMTHTGEKPFKCHLCDFACRRNKELRHHMSKHIRLDEEDIKPSPLESQIDN